MRSVHKLRVPRPLLFWWWFAVVAGLHANQAETDSPNLMRVIMGQVVGEDEKPVARAMVVMRQGTRDLARASTDSDGRYRMTYIGDAPSADLLAARGDRGSLKRNVSLETMFLRTDFRLEQGAVITGKVRDFSGRRHQQVMVSASQNGQIRAWAQTDASGSYRLLLHQPGTYEIQCRTSHKVVSPRSENGVVTVTAALGSRLGDVDFQFMRSAHGHWRTFRNYDGLGTDHVSAIHESEDGTLWFGTNRGGLANYDGSHFTTAHRNDGLMWNHVHCLWEDDRGHLWVGTSHGYCRQENGQFHREPGGWVRSIIQDDRGTIWMRRRNGIVRLEDDQEVLVQKLPGVRGVGTLLLGHSGQIWAGSEKQGVYRFNKQGGRTQFTTRDGLPSLAINALCFASDGTLWGGSSHGVFWFDGKHFHTFGPEDGIAATSSITSLFPDTDGSMWIGTRHGLVHYDGKHFSVIGTEDGLAHQNVNAIHRDRGGILWIGTNGGLSRYDDRSVQRFTSADGLTNGAPNRITLDDSGHMWLGADRLLRFDGTEFKRESGRGSPTSPITSIEQGPDALWMTTARGGLHSYDGNRFASAKAPVTRIEIPKVHFDSKGMRWVIGRGVCRIDPETDAPIWAKGLDDTQCSAIATMGDRFAWIGSREEGLIVYDYEREEVFTRFTEIPDIDALRIKDIHVSANGTVWLAADGGLARFLAESPQTRESLAQGQWQTFTQDDGYAHASVTRIFESDDGILWFTNGAGVSQFDGVAWSFLDTRDGLAGNKSMDMDIDDEGALWIASNFSGITRYQRHLEPPEVTIVDVEMAAEAKVGGPIMVHCQSIDAHTLPHKQQFRYRVRSASATVQEGKSQPHWRGDENADGWSLPTTSASFEWVPEEAGDYVVDVQSINRDLQYSKMKSRPITFTLPWYRNPWITVPLGFILVCLLGALLGYASRYYSQRRETQRKQAQLLRLTTDKNEILNIVAHDLRTPLWTSMNFAELLLKHPEMDRAKSEKIAEDILSGSQRMMTLVERLLDVHAIESGDIRSTPTNCDLIAIAGEVIDSHRANAEAKSVTLSLGGRTNAKAKVDPLLLSRVLDNLISNAIKFSPRDTTICVEVGPHRIRVADEGPGFTEADRQQLFQKFARLSGQPTAGEPSMGLGLFAAKRLAEMLNGTLTLETSAQGATFLLELPDSGTTSQITSRAVP